MSRALAAVLISENWQVDILGARSKVCTWAAAASMAGQQQNFQVTPAKLRRQSPASQSSW